MVSQKESIYPKKRKRLTILSDEHWVQTIPNDVDKIVAGQRGDGQVLPKVVFLKLKCRRYGKRFRQDAE